MCLLTSNGGVADASGRMEEPPVGLTSSSSSFTCSAHSFSLSSNSSILTKRLALFPVLQMLIVSIAIILLSYL